MTEIWKYLMVPFLQFFSFLLLFSNFDIIASFCVNFRSENATFPKIWSDHLMLLSCNSAIWTLWSSSLSTLQFSNTHFLFWFHFIFDLFDIISCQVSFTWDSICLKFLFGLQYENHFFPFSFISSNFDFKHLIQALLLAFPQVFAHFPFMLPNFLLTLL